MGKIRTALLIGMLVLLSACGGQGGGSSGAPSSVAASGGQSGATTTTTTTPVLTNFATITVDAGPASLNTGPNAYTADNTAYVSVTLCAPGTTNCQTIDHVRLDTGSVGLRIMSSVLNTSLASAMPIETDANGATVGECYGFVSGYSFGPVRQADVKIGGEAVANMPFQIMGAGDAFAEVPSQCSSGAGTQFDSPSSLGANGILGIGVTTTDCGTYCTQPNNYASAIYYACSSGSCGATTVRAASTTAPFQQLPNPVAALAVDNNGTIISLPAVPAAGQVSVTGTLYFGIGTQTNNGLGSATVVQTTSSSGSFGPGLISATYNGQTLPNSIIDSGTTADIFTDSTIPKCTQSDLTSFYCPTSPLNIQATLTGADGATTSVTVAVNSALSFTTNDSAALPGLSATFDGPNAYPNSFTFGLPFFYGRNVYTALEQRNAGGTVGPYIAF